MSFRIRVLGYTFPRVSYLLSESGSLAPTKEDLPGTGCSGMGTVVTIGLWSRRSVSCSLFQLNGHVWLQLDERRFCLSDGSFKAKQRLAAPFVRRFIVSDGESNRTAVDFRYWFLGFHDPWPDSGDFFEYVARSTKNRQALAEFICFWQARAASREDITAEETAAVEDCVRKRMATRC